MICLYKLKLFLEIEIPPTKKHQVEFQKEESEKKVGRHLVVIISTRLQIFICFI